MYIILPPCTKSLLLPNIFGGVATPCEPVYLWMGSIPLQTNFYKPIGSMYGICLYIWLILMVNVGKYTIHGSYGSENKKTVLKKASCTLFVSTHVQCTHCCGCLVPIQQLGMTCNGRYWAAKEDGNNAAVFLIMTPWLRIGFPIDGVYPKGSL